MTSQSPAGPSRQTRKRNQTRLTVCTPSARVIFAFAALFILFLWLHLILALEIETTGRQIQTRTEELARQERQNDALRHRIAIAESQQNMAQRARDLGYEPQTPVFLLLLSSPTRAGEDKGIQPTGDTETGQARVAP